jgi:hypothetical protein
MAAQSLNQGRPVTAPEAKEMRRRLAAGQSVNHIANAMGRSWTSVNRYARGLSWIETRNPRRSAEDHRRDCRLARQRYERDRKIAQLEEQLLLCPFHFG